MAIIRKMIFVVCICVFTNNSFGQKLYIWCPKEQSITSRPGFLQNEIVDLVIFDGRVVSKESKVECTSENMLLELQKVIKESYPAASFNLLTPENYYKDPQPNRITIKIGIAAYHAAFGVDVKVGIGNIGGSFSSVIIPEGKWNGLTAYSIKVYDYRSNGETKRTKDISEISSKPNLVGYKTARDCLNNSFIEANQKMLFFIDESLMK